MFVRSFFRRGLAVAAVSAAGLIALSGCQFVGKDDAADPAASAPASAPASGKATPTGAAKGSTRPSARAGELPDVCGLLTRAEVAALSGGHQVTQVDKDGAAADATTRHCQWQMSGARLAVFLSKTTGSDFRAAHSQGQKVTGVGDEAVSDSGHLYVRTGSIEIDVYATLSGDQAAEAQMAKATAQKLVPKL
jgi:hypothetical protein